MFVTALTHSTLPLTIGGGSIPYDSLVEFAIEVSDAAGYRSPPYILSTVTPSADGSDGETK